MTPELIIFDCDGVLVNSEPISSRLIAQQLTDLGLPISAAAFESRFAGTALAEIIAFYESKTGKKVPGDFEEVYRQRSWIAFEAELEPIKGIPELLENLTVATCVASNGPRNKIDFNLRVTKLDHYFEKNIFSAYDIQRWKPLPDLYLHASKRMGITPEKCIVVEDSTHGVEAALAAGIRVLGYPGGATSAEALAKAGAEIIEDMREVLTLF